MFQDLVHGFGVSEKGIVWHSESSGLKCSLFFFFLYIGFIYLFLERGEGREKERERNTNVWLPLAWPPPGTLPATQACALTGN